MEKLFVVTKNEAKIIAIKNVFYDFDVVPVVVKTNTIKQPLSEEETFACAKIRASAINYGYRLGLEAGVTLINDVCFLVNYGVLIDKDNNEYYGGGFYFPLPDVIKEELYQNKLELKDAMKKHYGNVITDRGGTIEFLTNGEVTRIDIFTSIGKMLRGQIKKKQEEN